MSLALALALCSAVPPAPAARDARYEERLVKWALELYGKQVDPAPEGKTIEQIYVASENIIAPSDPWPLLANAIHVKSRESTVRRQLLFAEGQAYSQALAAETERNMRTLFIFAVSRVVAVKGSSPDKVGVVVVTKDLWSIRLEWDFNLVGSLLQYLNLVLAEENLLGLDKTLHLDFFYKLDTVSFGAQYYDPRLLGTRLELIAQNDVVFNRGTKRAEGDVGALQVDRPLFSLETEWGFSVNASWNATRTRVYRGAQIWTLPYPDAQAAVDQVPLIYDTRVLGALATVTRSFGRHWKRNVSWGMGGHVRRYTPPYSPLYSDDERAWLTSRFLPYSETAAYLTASVSFFEAEYRVLRDIDTFALSEDFQLGPSAVATVRWAEPAWASPIRFFEGGAAARYRAYRFDDLFTASAAATARYMPGVSSGDITGPWVNERVAIELRNYSPPFGVGRLVARGLFDWRRNDLNHGFDFLGGDLGLRGLSADALAGTGEALFNLEYRTRPLELYTVHLGFVFFYDAGNAFTLSLPAPLLVHAVGLGLRILLPQINVQPIRIDLGYAFNGPLTPFLNEFSASFGQVTDVRPAFLDTPL